MPQDQGQLRHLLTLLAELQQRRLARVRVQHLRDPIQHAPVLLAEVRIRPGVGPGAPHHAAGPTAVIRPAERVPAAEIIAPSIPVRPTRPAAGAATATVVSLLLLLLLLLSRGVGVRPIRGPVVLLTAVAVVLLLPISGLLLLLLLLCLLLLLLWMVVRPLVREVLMHGGRRPADAFQAHAADRHRCACARKGRKCGGGGVDVIVMEVAPNEVAPAISAVFSSCSCVLGVRSWKISALVGSAQRDYKIVAAFRAPAKWDLCASALVCDRSVRGKILQLER